MLLTLGLAQSAFANDGEIDPSSGLVLAEGWEQVRAHCGGCHSLELVRQNRGDADYWQKLIRWMQAEHGLWDLGPAETPVVDYLARHYGAPAVNPRRAPLNTTWWEDTPP